MFPRNSSCAGFQGRILRPGIRPQHFLISWPLAAAALLLSACASMVSTSSHTVKKPPFYHGRAPISAESIGRFPAVVDRCMWMSDQSFGWDETFSKVLDSIDGMLAGYPFFDVLPAVQMSQEQSPGIFLGAGEQASEDDESQLNVLEVTSPSKNWSLKAAEMMRGKGLTRALFVSVSITDHWVRQRGLLGKKVLDLGTGYIADIPWLTDLETPIQVFQVNGIILDANGKVMRSGSEGIAFTRTPFLIGALLGAQQVMDKETVERLLTEERREDLKGAPLKLEAAIQNLVAQLTGQAEVLMPLPSIEDED